MSRRPAPDTPPVGALPVFVPLPAGQGSAADGHRRLGRGPAPRWGLACRVTTQPTGLLILPLQDLKQLQPTVRQPEHVVRLLRHRRAFTNPSVRQDPVAN